MLSIYALVITVVVIALIFDFLNGFHDAANAIATVVITKTLSPLQAVLLAGFANFVGYFTLGTAVAKTIGKDVVNISMILKEYDVHVSLLVILAGLVGAAVWDLLTWFWGLPTSSSHALIGGLVGSAMAAAGFEVIIGAGVIKIASFIIIAPLLGMISAVIFTIIIMWVCRNRNPVKMRGVFKKLQLVSAAAYSVSHGTNDAQKTMGIIVMALVAAGFKTGYEVDHWIILSCYLAISIGTMFGGWRIVKTMGTRITKITAMEGFSAETSSALVLFTTAQFGIPVSTTHVIAGSIMGVGTVEHGANVRWITARKIVWAWILTIPASAACAAITFWIVNLFL